MRNRGASVGIVSGGWFDSSAVLERVTVECGGLLVSSFYGGVETFPVRQPFLRWSGFIESGPAKIRGVARSNAKAEPRRPANEMWGSLGGQRSDQRRAWPSLARATGWALSSFVMLSRVENLGAALPWIRGGRILR